MLPISHQLLALAWAARERAAEQKTGPSTDTTAVIILAAAAAEGFINELTELAYRQGRDQRFQVPEVIRSFAEATRDIDDKPGGVRHKYLVASQVLGGTMFDRNANPFQDFDVLLRLRDGHLHVRGHDREEKPLQPAAAVVKLQQRGLARSPDSEHSVPWVQALQTADMAAWACDTVLNMIGAILDLIPDGDTPNSDISFGFKKTFRRTEPGVMPWQSRPP